MTEPIIALARQGACSLAQGHARLGQTLATLRQPNVHITSASCACFVRVEVEVDGVSEPAHWLAHQNVCPRLYFSNQHKSLRVAGVGCAERVGGISLFRDHQWRRTFHDILRSSPRSRFYGGTRFDIGSRHQEDWASFGGCLFVLPMWELQVDHDGLAYLACHLRWAAGDDAPSAMSWDQAVLRALEVWQILCPMADPIPLPQQTLPTLLGHHGSFTAHGWEKAVNEVLGDIEAGRCSKVVLAQRVRLHFGVPIEPLHLLLRFLDSDVTAVALDEAVQPASSVTTDPPVAEHARGAHFVTRRYSYLFLLQLDPVTSFMGCTPEKLFKLEGDRLFTEALAGTRPRGDTIQADNSLAHDLLHCAKDVREVHAVRDFLIRTLEPACHSLEHSAPFVLQLRHVQHICFPIAARLAATEENQPVRSALVLLHPTPAVCGHPSADARETIRRLEQFDRGWYAGPFGYFSADEGEYCVAIRSALLCGSQAFIFAGAGIVRGSSAPLEWEEVHVKMKVRQATWHYEYLLPELYVATPLPLHPTLVIQCRTLSRCSPAWATWCRKSHRLPSCPT